MPDSAPSAPEGDGPARDPLAAEATGQALVSFAYGPEDILTTAHRPMPAALLALWFGSRVLLVHDRYRRSWKLPGGMIEPGGTRRAAAWRELREETGQTPDGPEEFVGPARFHLGPERHSEFLALSTGRIERPSQADLPDK
ncbi:NUDIX hydrolase [Streptomyces sp. NBC_00102]|uniref:NUDIX hydrolase n=1 Tax=Streptomyces sp. NBC_00102 TaxID=2975652 RepID=UPI002251A751|nr:NUDIX domain-containing protein [Streptomyces sp. NBC_00102]MCX5401487.1 NUDIX domain-containing protein [Streptomyces sp. NBC_00102]